LFRLICAMFLIQVALPGGMSEARIVALPSYPQSPLSRVESGEVIVNLIVKNDGDVQSAKAVSGPERLRPVAEDAARRWRFNRAQQRQRTIQLTFAFILRKMANLDSVSAAFKPPARVEIYAEPREIQTIFDPAVDLPQKKD
jgi:TonB family protein